MIISHTHKFIFVKTKKTAGSSIEKLLYNHLGEEDICTGSVNDGTPNLNYPAEKDGHINWSRIRDRYPNEWGNYFKFTVERNPWDFCVSQFFWYQQTNKSHKTKRGFESFLVNPKNNYTNWKLYGNADGTVNVDRVLRYEKLHEEFNSIADHVPYNNDLLDTFVKKSKRPVDYREMYTKETQQIVAERFKQIINYMEYSF
jgi:hypothetical protein